MPAASRIARATPTPMPAWAPVLKPRFVLGSAVPSADVDAVADVVSDVAAGDASEEEVAVLDVGSFVPVTILA